MRKYELMVIINPEIDPTDTKKVNAVVNKLLGEDAKHIKNTNIWGKKALAYEINHLREGVYALYTLEAPKININSIAKQAKLMTDVIRYSLILV